MVIKMKILKTTSLVLLLLTLLLSPLIIVSAVILSTPRVYENTIYGELDDKFELLRNTEGEKIIVIGGSSVAFGLDSKALSENTGMPVVNFGLYAAIGTKAMLELSLAGIGKGDVVVLAPELDRQTLSSYFSAEHILPAIDGDYSMLPRFGADSLLSILGGSFKFAQDKLTLANSPPDPAGIYNSKNFNEYGDIKAGLRDGNIMQLYYDPATSIDLSADIVEAEFIDYINDYIKTVERKGAKVYFSYCPMNEAALAEGSDGNSIAEFESFLKKNIKCEFISSIENYIYDKAYFYDTNYHLNDTGVKLRTAYLSEDILIALGDLKLIDKDISPPPLPELDIKYFGEEDENCRYFTFEKMANGAYMISGLTELGKTAEALTVPLGYEGYKVTAIGSSAFAGGSAVRVNVTDDTNLRNFLDGAFESSMVVDLYIYYDFTREEDKLAPCADFGGIRIHVKEGSSYTTHYDWRDSSGGYDLLTDIE